MPHAQKQLPYPSDEKDDRILAEKKEKHIKRRSKILSDEEGPVSSSASLPAAVDSSTLPSPGALQSPRKNQNRNSYLGTDDDDEFTVKAVKKICAYVGSFTVAHLSPPSRAEFVRLQLQTLQTPKRSRDVLLFISLSGIKVCDPEDDGVVLMAHALKRISYATCDPDYKQFAFLARNPKGPVGIQYCHVFVTTEKYEVEEINAIVSKAFKVAYASIRSKRQFAKLVDELNKEQEEYQLQVQKYIDARNDQKIRPEDLAEKQPLISPDRVRGVGVGQSRVWAKQVAGRVSHKQPHLRGGTEIVDEGKEKEEGNNSTCSCSSKSVAPVSNSTSSNEGTKPSAPPLPVGETQGQQELMAKQTQKAKQFPPAPYYEAEVGNDWDTMPVVPPSGIAVVPETESDQSCHILLQNELSPPALPPSPTTPPTPPTNGRHMGQILLQDSSVPPPFTYNPRDDGRDEGRSRKNSREELDDDRYPFGDDADMEDTVCLLNDGDEDDEDFRYQMKCAEQFINAIGDIESTDDELEYPWRRHMSSEDDEDERQEPVTPSENVSEADAEKAEMEKRAKIKANYAVPRPPMRAVFSCDPYHPEEEKLSKAQPTPETGSKVTSDPSEEGPPYQRLGYSPPKPVPRQKKNTRNSVIKDSENMEKERSKRHKNSLEGENGEINSESRSDQRHLTVDHPHSKGLSKSTEELSTRPKVNGEHVKTKLGASSNSSLHLPSSENKENLPHSNNSSNERRKRAPGHVNHKVEIEIGQFKVKKTATAERGSVPPLPPRSSSLHQSGPRAPADQQESKRAVDNKIIRAPWFKAGIPKDIAFEILRHQDKGAFIVRESKSHTGCFAISIKVDTSFNDSRIANYLVVRTKNGGYTIKGFGRDFPDLPRLVHYYSLHQEQLPCKLVFSGTNPLYKQGGKQGDDSDGEEDPDYKKLTDFSSMLL